MKLLRLTSLTALMAALLSQASAAPIVPLSYSFTGYNGGHPDDTGNQLTNGLYADLVPGLSLATNNEWVGWDGGTPSITFNFGSVVTINQVSLSMGNWNNAAVYLPEDIVIGGTAFTVDPFGYTPLSHTLLVFNGGWTGSSLTINLDSSFNRWIFIDEVTFNEGPAENGNGNSVPDASATLPLLAIGLAGFAALRRRRA